MRLGCVGIGSNAIRLLTAEWDGEKLCRIRRERRGTRLFAGLVAGRLTGESMGSSVEAVCELCELAKRDGAQEIFIFATSAVRDAENGAEFTAACEKGCGVPVEIASGEEEAVLSYIGATQGGRCGVIDIGGGSTEFTLGDGRMIQGAKSLQVGAVRMHAVLPILTEADYLTVCARCETLIREQTQEFRTVSGGRVWTGVGGTMTMLGAMQKGVELFDPESCEGMLISRGDTAAWGRRLSAMSLEARAGVVGLMPRRVDIMPAGIAILEAAMRVFDIPAIHLSAHGNMDGYLKIKFEKRG